MQRVKSFRSWMITESFNEDPNYWYQKLDASHKDYVESEEDYNNPDNDWDEEEYGPKFWIFTTPVHEYLKNKDMLSILPAIIKFGESIGLSADLVKFEHYMMNDFSINWEGHDYPNFSISLEGDEHETQAMIINTNTDRTLHDIVGAHLIIRAQMNKTDEEIEWSLTSNNDIPEVMMDIYDLKNRINK